MRTIDKVPVLNATKQAVIHIKPLDVKRGNTGDPGKCAAARACVHDLHASAALVHVARTYVQMTAKAARQFVSGRNEHKRGPVWVRFRTPLAVRTEVVTFDRASKFQPGTYTLPPLQPSHRATGRRIGGPHKKRKTYVSRRPRPRHVLAGVRKFEPQELASAEK